MVFFKLSKTSRPYWTASTMAEKNQQDHVSCLDGKYQSRVPRAYDIGSLERWASLTPSPSCHDLVSGLDSRTIRSSARGLYERTQFHDNRKAAPTDSRLTPSFGPGENNSRARRRYGRLIVAVLLNRERDSHCERVLRQYNATLASDGQSRESNRQST